MMSAAALQLAVGHRNVAEWSICAQIGGSAERWNISPAHCGLMDTDGSYADWKGPYYGGETIDPWGNPYFFDP